MTGTGSVTAPNIRPASGLRLLVLAAIACAALCYELYVLSLAARPQVNWERELYYLDRAAPCYIPPGALDLDPRQRLTFTAATVDRWRPRLGHGWQVTDGVARLAGTGPATIHLLIRAEPRRLATGGRLRLALGASALPHLAARVNGQAVPVSVEPDGQERHQLMLALPPGLLRADGCTTVQLAALDAVAPAPALRALELELEPATSD